MAIIQQLSKIVKNFFQVGDEREWFGQVSNIDFLVFSKVVRVGERGR
jgi:hypothetical protein